MLTGGILQQFEALLNGCFQSAKPQEIGSLSVSFFANELHLSANNFGDLMKRETGQTAQENIQVKLIDVAKEQLSDPAKTAVRLFMSGL